MFENFLLKNLSYLWIFIILVKNIILLSDVKQVWFFNELFSQEKHTDHILKSSTDEIIVQKFLKLCERNNKGM